MTEGLGTSPWLGQVRSYEEFQKFIQPRWDDPFKEKPKDHIFVDGFNGYLGKKTRYRIGLELWLDGHGFLYREALSCEHCALNGRMRAALQYLNEKLAPNPESSIYITERVTPMYNEVNSRFPIVIGSEYLPDTTPGTMKDGVLCQDVQNLTFDDGVFDYVLSFDVLEHVPDYRKAIGEIYRVLKPGGIFLFTVPIGLDSPISHTRAEINENGEVEHILEEEYHGNPLGPPSLCFTSFGFDMIDDLRNGGFSDSYAELYGNKALGYWGPAQPLIVAVK